MIGALGLFTPLGVKIQFYLAYHAICFCIAASFFMYRALHFGSPLTEANRAEGDRRRPLVCFLLPLPDRFPHWLNRRLRAKRASKIGLGYGTSASFIQLALSVDPRLIESFLLSKLVHELPLHIILLSSSLSHSPPMTFWPAQTDHS